MAKENLQPSNDVFTMGRQLVPHPTVTWDTSVHIPRDPEPAWQLLSRIGLPEENGAGYYLPKWLERGLPATLHSVDSVEADQLPPQRQPGDRLRDFPQDSVATVAAIDHDARALILDSRWPKGVHYAWAIRVNPREDGSEVQTSMRMEGVKHPTLMQRIVPALDQWGTKQLGRGLAERIPRNPGEPTRAEVIESQYRTRIVLASLGLVAGEALRRSSNSVAQKAGSLTMFGAGYVLARASLRRQSDRSARG